MTGKDRILHVDPVGEALERYISVLQAELNSINKGKKDAMRWSAVIFPIENQVLYSTVELCLAVENNDSDLM